MQEFLPNNEDVKLREVRFCTFDPIAEPARDAAQLLMNAPGIENVQTLTRDTLQVCYDLRLISQQIIEESLAEIGFHLENSLLCRLRRALIYYSEETQLANMGRSHDQANATLDIHMHCYQLRRHGCRDPRPEHLRHYS